MNNRLKKIYKPDNDIFGLPQIYKGISFYPIKVNQLELKERYQRLLWNPKNYIPDRTVLRMSYLKFLFYVIQQAYDDINLIEDLIKFLQEVTKVEKVEIRYNEIEEIEDPFERINFRIFINNCDFNEQEFEDIREIILEQNGSSLDYIESYNPELEKKLNFVNSNMTLDLKDEIYSFCAMTGLSEKDVGELTLYQYKNRFERETMFLMYKLFKPLEISGQIQAKNKKELIGHYFTHTENAKSRYASIMVDAKSFIEQAGFDANNNGLIST